MKLWSFANIFVWAVSKYSNWGKNTKNPKKPEKGRNKLGKNGELYTKNKDFVSVFKTTPSESDYCTQNSSRIGSDAIYLSLSTLITE